MKPEDPNADVVNQEKVPEEEYSLDGVAKGLASGTLSRPRALRMFGAALLSAVLVPVLPKEAHADSFKRQCRKKKGTLCESGPNKVCCPEGTVCGQVLGGGEESVCVERSSIEWEIDCSLSSLDLCLNGKVCATCSAGASMGRGLCAGTLPPLPLKL